MNPPNLPLIEWPGPLRLYPQVIDPQEFAGWAQKMMKGEKGAAMAAQIIREEHEGILVDVFLTDHEEMKTLFDLNFTQGLKAKAYAALVVNRQKKACYQRKLDKCLETCYLYAYYQVPLPSWHFF